MQDEGMEQYIEFRHISKIFPGQKALDDVSFSVSKGEIHALLGENGAGKSTLLNILYGIYPPTEGKILIDSREVNFANSSEAIKFGIAKVHQEINVIPELTVAENIMLGNEIVSGLFLNKRRMIEETQKLLEMLGCNFHASDKMRGLSAGKKQMVQIAKALFLKAQIISFDEPTSSLSSSEVESLFSIIRQLKAQGITVIYISHKMDEIFKICDRATILRDGKYICDMDMKEAKEETLVQSMVGRDVSLFAKRMSPSRAQYDKEVLMVENLAGEAGFKDISFTLYKGEILGFFGLVGALRTETMRVIFGADKSLGGRVLFNGKPLHKTRTPYYSVQQGIGLISENRKEEGFVKNMNNADNIALPCIKKFERGPFVNRKLKYGNSRTLGQKVGLTPNDPEFMTMSLSGGNAQKVILAKWLSTNADLLILDEPTKGIDIGAKTEIYKLLEELVKEGKSIIIVSSELPEVMGMCDRIVVMHEGKIVSTVKRDDFSEERIIALAVGGK
jgi:ABC-type sugar transport system ATPase subunit